MSMQEYVNVVSRDIEMAAAAGSDDEDFCWRGDIMSIERQETCPAT
jgi:hypothetical protein